MYLRVASGTCNPSRVDDLLVALREHGQPIMRQSPGFQHLYVGVDRTTGEVVIVSTWDTKEHADVQFAVPELSSRLQALELQMGQPRAYEVTDQV